MKKIFFILMSVLLFASALLAQDKLPPISSLKTEADLERTKPDLIKAADWLEKTPFNTQKERRKEVERFVFMWVSASKKYDVDMNSKILNLDDKNPGLVMIYTAAAAKYLVNGASGTAAREAGLNALTHVYKKRVGIKKDKNIEELLKAQKRNKVKQWIQS